MTVLLTYPGRVQGRPCQIQVEKISIETMHFSGFPDKCERKMIRTGMRCFATVEKLSSGTPSTDDTVTKYFIHTDGAILDTGDRADAPNTDTVPPGPGQWEWTLRV